MLVAEDEPLIALEMAKTLLALGCRVVGPVRSVEEAFSKVSTDGDITAAVLDVNLDGHSALPVAELLEKLGIPFLWATGYGVMPDGARSSSEVLQKPLGKGDLEAALRRALVRGSPSGG